MNKLIIFICIFFIGCQTQNILLKCEVENVRMAPGFKGYGLQKIICYNYTYKGLKYRNCSKIDHILVDVGDTVKISFNSKNPQKAKIISVIRNQSEHESKAISRNYSERIYSYQRVEEKPLFYKAKVFTENDSLVNKFIVDEIIKTDNEVEGRIGIYITIKADGNVFIRKITSDNLKLEILVSEIIKKMPKWKPGKNRGSFVNVSFLVDLELKNKE